MLKLSEVAQLLNCSLSNVYALIEQGKLAVIPTGAGGKGYRVAPEELERFKEERKRGRGYANPWPERARPRSPQRKTAEWF